MARVLNFDFVKCRFLSATFTCDQTFADERKGMFCSGRNSENVYSDQCLREATSDAGFGGTFAREVRWPRVVAAFGRVVRKRTLSAGCVRRHFDIES